MAFVVAAGLLGAAWLWTHPSPKSLFSRGFSVVSRDPATAERFFRQAIAAADGRYPDAQLGLCVALARQKNWDDAQKLFSAIDPSSCRADVLLAFGREALDADRIAEAEQALKEVAGRDTRERDAALALLLAGYRRWGLQNELIAVGQKLTQTQPDRFEVWAVLVEALRGMKLEKECLETASQALENDPPEDYRREFQYTIVEMSITAGDAERGAKELAKLRALEGDSFRVRASAASLYRLQGRLDESLQLAKSLFTQTGKQTTAHLIRGFVWLDLGQYEKAISDLQQVVAEQPFNVQAHFKLSEALRALGRQAEALSHSKIATDLSTKRVRINTLLKQRAGSPKKDPLLAEQLAALFDETGDRESAAHWRREARDGRDEARRARISPP